MLETIATPGLWAGFVAFVMIMIALDLGVFHRKAHAVTLKEALGWSALWVVLAAIFGAWVWRSFGEARGLEFATGYLIEKALAVDNIFVFAIIFSYFAIPAALQHRVLFWGIFGALILRAGFIFAGGAFLARFHWAIYVFGAILLLTGIKLLLQREDKFEPERNPLVRLVRRILPVTGFEGERFLTRVNGRRAATPLLLALVAVEASDVVFAVDSIPAIYAVTQDPFIVFTSNIFAILGLRSMYFLLAGILDRFHYLKVGLALVLVFVGAKMTLIEIVKVPIAASLAIVALLLAGSVVASVLRPRPAGAPEGQATPSIAIVPEA